MTLLQKFASWPEDQISRWLWLRAVEWKGFPAFISLPIVPVMCIFFPWYQVIGVVFLLEIPWVFVRHIFVNVRVATFACIVVSFSKWPAAISSTIYLGYRHQLMAGVIALLWPLLGGLVGLVSGFVSGLAGIPDQTAVIELAFAKKIGFVSQPAEDFDRFH